jgi:threonine dehydrogenase-like Zn-dependent dehydrogenase
MQVFWCLLRGLPRKPNILNTFCRIVESVGEGVTSVKPGDHVIPAWVADCGKCFHCKQGKSNCCDVLLHNFDSGVMLSDKKTRFTTLDGKPIYHFFGISTFSQYSVMDEASCAKVNPKAPWQNLFPRIMWCCHRWKKSMVLHLSLWWWVHTIVFCWCAWSLQITFSGSQISFLWSSSLS